MTSEMVSTRPTTDVGRGFLAGVEFYSKSVNGEPDLDRPLYWEQDPPAVMLHNYLSVLAGREDEEQEEDIHMLERFAA